LGWLRFEDRAISQTAAMAIDIGLMLFERIAGVAPDPPLFRSFYSDTWAEAMSAPSSA
jgi:hypothetical protein